MKNKNGGLTKGLTKQMIMEEKEIITDDEDMVEVKSSKNPAKLNGEFKNK